MSQLHKSSFIPADYLLTLFCSLNFTSHSGITVPMITVDLEYAVLALIVDAVQMTIVSEVVHAS